MSTEVQSQNIWTEETTTTKSELAEMYVDFLDTQKWWVVATGTAIGVNLNPFRKEAVEYLTSGIAEEEQSDIFSTIGKNLKKAITEKLTWNMDLEYDQVRLNAMKQIIIANQNNTLELENLKQKIALGIDPTLDGVPVTTVPATTVPTVNTSDYAPTISSSVEEITDRRTAVITNLAAILAQDKKNDIKYNRWWHTSIDAWLDCGGLIVYASNQAGLKVEDNGRSLFQKFPSKKLEVDGNGEITTDTSQFKEWDILVFDSLNPAYHDASENKSRQYKITWTDGQKIHPHHFAYIKSFDRKRGIVNIIESNGSQGVTESECSIAKWLDEKQVGKRTSALHAVHINYDELEKLSTNDIAKLEELPGSQMVA